MASFRNVPIYLWDFYFAFYDLLDFIEFSERNIDWQCKSHKVRLDRISKYHKYDIDEYYEEKQKIKYRFEISLPLSIRYSAIIAFATLIEWIGKFLIKHKTITIRRKSKEKNDTIHYLEQFYYKSECKLYHNIGTLENIIKIRNCIAHANGSVEEYKHSNEIISIIKSQEGFGIYDHHYLGKVINIDKGAIEKLIKDTENWIIDFIEECRKNNLLKI